MKYELVAGLETHVELSTKTKIFCRCTTQFGGEPNTHCCPHLHRPSRYVAKAERKGCGLRDHGRTCHAL